VFEEGVRLQWKYQPYYRKEWSRSAYDIIYERGVIFLLFGNNIYSFFIFRMVLKLKMSKGNSLMQFTYTNY
jgi:hypothetical protein